MKLKCNSCDGVYSDSLDVRFGKACDNDCKFCVEKGGLKGESIDVSKMIESTKKSGKKTICILGGEPFLYIEKLLEYIKGIREYAEKIYITTALPKIMVDKKEICFEILEIIDGLNCSVHFYTDDKNNIVLNNKDKVSGYSRINTLTEIAKTYGSKIRMKCNLVKGIMDNKEDLIKYVKFMNSIHVGSIKFNEIHSSKIAPDASDYVSFEKIMCIKLPSPYAHGCETQHKILNYDIFLKRTCFAVNPNAKASLADLFKAIKKRKHITDSSFSVLYESGELSKYWK